MMFLAILLSTYDHGVGQTVIPVGTQYECDRLVQAWNNQKRVDLSFVVPDVRFKGYCINVR